jgi:hypothetical protein
MTATLFALRESPLDDLKTCPAAVKNVAGGEWKRTKESSASKGAAA